MDFKEIRGVISGLRKVLSAHQIFFLVAAAAVVATVAFSAFQVPLKTLFTLMVITLIAPLSIRFPFAAFIAFLITRSIVDVAAENDVISVSGMSLNLSALMGIAFNLWGCWYIAAYRPRLRLPALPFLIMLIAIGVLGALSAQDRLLAIQELIKIINYGILFIIGYHLAASSGSRYRTMVAAAAGAIVVPIAVAAYQVTFERIVFPPEGHLRLQGTFGHPNAFADALVFALGIWMIARLLFRSPDAQAQIHDASTNRTTASVHEKIRALLARIDYRVACAVILFFLLFTYTRGAWIGAGVLLVSYGMRYARAATLAFVASATIAVMVFAAAAKIIYANTGINLFEISFIQRINPDSEDHGSVTWRLRSWREMLPTVRQAPLFGYGLGSFQQLRERTVTYSTDLGATEAHNDYLRLAVETGAAGAVCYVLFFIAVIATLVKRSLAIRDENMQKILTVLAGTVAAFMIMSFSDNLLRATAVFWLVWATVGGTLAVTGTNVKTHITLQNK